MESESDDTESDMVKTIMFSKYLGPYDLLSVLQGVCPIKNGIVIATTNNIEEVRKYDFLCRPGRLTPMHFPPLREKMFIRMLKWHFPNEEITINTDIDKYEFPHSAILELITLIEQTYGKFVELFNKMICEKSS